MTPEYWTQACRELSKADPVMKKLIKTYKGEALVCKNDAFNTLARSIIGQQISVKAADSIWSRFVGTLPELHPKYVLKTEPESLRAVGLSNQKVIYINEIARFFEAHHHAPVWEEDDELLIRQLTSIKGIGRWTAEMFMIFHLLRPDVFPIQDLGLLKSIYLYYNGGKAMEKQAVLKLAEQWRPWRTVATWHLWRALDPVPVEY